jgi:hypothetical protein
MIQQARNRVMRDRRRHAKQIRKQKHRGRDSGPFSLALQMQRPG